MDNKERAQKIEQLSIRARLQDLAVHVTDGEARRLVKICAVLTEGKIRVSKRWAKRRDGDTKTKASDGHVPLHPLLAEHLREWRSTTPHGADTDFVFPSLKEHGRVPLSGSVFVADFLRPAAVQPGQRFGLHNLQVLATPGVASADKYIVRFSNWKTPEGAEEAIQIVGFQSLQRAQAMEQFCSRTELAATLGRVCVVARGPKPAAATARTRRSYHLECPGTKYLAGSLAPAR